MECVALFPVEIADSTAAASNTHAGGATPGVSSAGASGPGSAAAAAAAAAAGTPAGEATTGQDALAAATSGPVTDAESDAAASAAGEALSEGSVPGEEPSLFLLFLLYLRFICVPSLSLTQMLLLVQLANLGQKESYLVTTSTYLYSYTRLCQHLLLGAAALLPQACLVWRVFQTEADAAASAITRFGQNRIYTPYMTVQVGGFPAKNTVYTPFI